MLKHSRLLLAALVGSAFVNPAIAANTKQASITKMFGAAAIPVGGSTTLSFTIMNPNASTSLTGIGFTDSLTGGLVVSSTNGLTGSCDGGTITATPLASSVSLVGATLAGMASCTFSVSVTGNTAGSINNSVTVTSSAGGNKSTASLTVLGPPSITKSFGAATIPVGGTTSLSFTVTNPNSTGTLTGINFTDTLMGGLQVVNPSVVTGTCDSGTITAVAASTSISLAGASLAGGGTCTFSVNVTGTTAGVINNSVTAASPDGGTGTAGTASLTVLGPPTITKSFGAATIPVGGTTSLSFTVTNPNSSGALTGINFTDTLTGGLVVASPNGVSGACNGGTVTAVSGSTSISLTGGKRNAGLSCTVTVNVTGMIAGVVNNSVQANSPDGGTGTAGTASITVLGPPSITKSFGAATIPVGGTTSLSFTVTNPNAMGTLTGINFTDTLTGGLVVSNPKVVTGSCDAGTITAVPGSTTISLTGAKRNAGVNCTFSVNVTGMTAGVVNNSVTVASPDGGTGNTAMASITVLSPPTITKTFGAATIAVGGATSLSFTVTNPNATGTLTGINFTDTLTGGLAVSNPSVVTGSCDAGTITAVAGSTTISLTGANRNAGANCTFSVNVTGNTAGQINNSVTASSPDGGTGTAGTASLTVLGPPTITKSFGAATIPVGGTTSLSFTVTNPNATGTLTGINFSDTVTGGLVVSNPSVVTGTCDGGTITAVAGSTTISLAGASLGGGTHCTFSVNVTGNTAGLINNSVTAASPDGGTGTAGTASITVLSPPTITKSFGDATIPVGGSTSLSFTVTNPNAPGTLTGINFTDTLLGGLQVATPLTVTGTCDSGTIAAVAGSTTISLAGATLKSGKHCTFSVNVTGTMAGVVNNSVTASSPDGGTGTAGTDSVTVIGPPSITKSFGAATIPLGGATSLSFTIMNPNTVGTLNGINFADTLLGGLQVANPNGLSGSCDAGTITAVAGSTTVSLSGAKRSAGASCTFSVNVTGTTAGVVSNAVTVASNNGGTGNTSTAGITVVAPPSITKAFGAPTFPVGGSTNLSLTIVNPNATVALSGVAFTDNLPAGMLVATPNNLSSNCNGTTTATEGSGSITLAGGTISAGTSCTISLSVTATTDGYYSNVSSVVSSSEGGSSTTFATAGVIAAYPPALTKAFAAVGLPVGATANLIFTLTNPNHVVDLTNVAFTDTLPAGVLISTPGGLTTDCGGTVTAPDGSSTITATGVPLSAPGGTCTITVSVTGTAAGVVNNTTSTVTSDQTVPGDPATATITVGNVFQISYASNLQAGDSVVNITNAGSVSGNDPDGRICANFYAFDPAEEMLACCSCIVTPNGLDSLSARADLINNTLTPGSPSSIVIKLLATALSAGGTCDASSPSALNLDSGLYAWGTTLHAAPNAMYKITESPFQQATLSASELLKLTSYCNFIETVGSGFGICKSCSAGGLGAVHH